MMTNNAESNGKSMEHEMETVLMLGRRGIM